MGCGETLILAAGGHVTCSRISCPEPDAASTLLEDAETEHVVRFTPDVFTVRHPLRERLHDDLMDCALHEHIAEMDGPPVPPGRYRARQSDGGWAWESLGSA
jgi:hypothetical protein